MPIRKATAVENLVEQAHDCAQLAAEQHASADKQMECVKKAVSNQHENADKLDLLGEALLDAAVKKQGQQELRRSEQGAPAETPAKQN